MCHSDQSHMTEFMFRNAAAGTLTLAEARKKLYADAYLRTASETLARCCGIHEDDPVLLRKTVTDLLLESDPSSKKDSIDRKVRSWINDRIQYISRKSALQLAFALKLSVDDAEEMLQRLCGEGFHWRDPEDIVLLFALDHRMSYTDACALLSRMAPMYRLPENHPDDRSTMTENIRQDVVRLQTEADLESFLRQSAPRLGTLHNTAYSLFCGFMELLKSSAVDDMLPGEEKMTSEEVLTTYLYQGLIPRGKKEKSGKGNDDSLLNDAIRRNIQQNWPDEFSLARIASRETDVTRKVLILLFLACDGGETEYGDFSDEEMEDIFEDTYTRLSSMLADCGFAPLDSRTPFDWMILYCMAADDMTILDEKISAFLSAVFQPSEAEDE